MSDEITNMSEQDRILGLRRDLQALLDKYQPTIRADKGYYDDIDAIEFTIGDKNRSNLQLSR